MLQIGIEDMVAMLFRVLSLEDFLAGGGSPPPPDSRSPEVAQEGLLI